MIRNLLWYSIVYNSMMLYIHFSVYDSLRIFDVYSSPVLESVFVYLNDKTIVLNLRTVQE